jgi:hypothetical protein
MILLLLTILAVAGWVVWIVLAAKNSDDGIDLFLPFFIGALVVGVPVVASICVSSDAYTENGTMLGLKQSLGLYEKTARELNSVAVVEPAGGAAIGGIENMRQSTNASGAWLDYRNKTVDVNLLVAKRKAQLRNPWINWLIPPLPPELEGWGK